MKFSMTAAKRLGRRLQKRKGGFQPDLAYHGSSLAQRPTGGGRWVRQVSKLMVLDGAQ